MARYIHPDVKDHVESASGETRVRLALVPAEGANNAVHERIRELDGDVERELPSGVLLVGISTCKLPQLFETEGIDSISPASGMEILG